MGGSPIVLGIAPGVFWFARGIQSVSYEVTAAPIGHILVCFIVTKCGGVSVARVCVRFKLKFQ
jgi:hypothetical protein